MFVYNYVCMYLYTCMYLFIYLFLFLIYLFHLFSYSVCTFTFTQIGHSIDRAQYSKTKDVHFNSFTDNMAGKEEIHSATSIKRPPSGL